MHHHIYAFSKHLYTKQLSVHSCQMLCLGIEPMSLKLQAPCSTSWAVVFVLLNILIYSVCQNAGSEPGSAECEQPKRMT